MNLEIFDQIYLIGAIGTLMNKDGNVVIDREKHEIKSTHVLEKGLKTITTMRTKPIVFSEREHYISKEIKMSLFGQDGEPRTGLLIKRSLAEELSYNIPYQNELLIEKLNAVTEFRPNLAEKIYSHYKCHHYLNEEEREAIRLEADQFLAWARSVARRDLLYFGYEISDKAYTFNNNSGKY